MAGGFARHQSAVVTANTGSPDGPVVKPHIGPACSQVAGFTGIGGRQMAAAFSACCGVVMATGAGTLNKAVIKGKRCPVSGGVALHAGFRRLRVFGRFTAGFDPVMTANTSGRCIGQFTAQMALVAGGTGMLAC